MSKKLIIDKKNRDLFKRYEIKRITLKSLANNCKITETTRHKINLELSQLPRNSSITRIKNRCILTGRSKSIYRKFKISRILLKKYITEGLISGYTKSSW